MTELRPGVGGGGLDRLIVGLVAAINTRALYPPGHPSVVRVIQQVLDAIAAACDDRHQDSITLIVFGDELVVDQRAVRRSGLHQQALVRALARHRIGRLTLSRELELAECQQFVDAIAGGKTPASTPHMILGQVEISILEGRGGTKSADPGGEAGLPDGPAGTPGSQGGGGLSSDQLGQAMEAFVRFRTERLGGLERLEDVIWNSIDALEHSAPAMLPLAPLRTHDEYTFIHSVNVALLVLGQARAFGLTGPMLHAIGIAALVHDVGKLSIPLEVLNKPGRLEGEEWRVMMSHAEVGARYLCGLERSAPLSMLVAYEHHLRFDGQSNYPMLTTPRQPTLASQLTALADVYDAVRTTRPYREGLSQEAAIEILRSRAGTFHDPFLVGHFCRLVGAPASQ